ncbi:chemotaxis protein CheB [Hahella sp. KA22]|uniref:chemotaxis protein CheB n=1 Tax=Hahella sp. KA22 TaxID=1628392 RepID=UPI000FDE6FF6|nr:chemotaxis protein CheB [Hahella sp. KA22]AZZ90065.1 chemotaxis protein CheB [Hahella sp. KA22]QAY53435.1 chemotaxis protein CheB [Hahella sp. KA22]
MSVQAAKVGIISDCPLQRHIMQSAVEGYGFSVIASCDPSRLSTALLERHAAAEVWIVILTDEDRWADAIDTLIDHSEAPVLFGLGEAPNKHSLDYAKWERRLFTKLVELLGEPPTLTQASASLTALEASPSGPSALPLPHHIRPGGVNDPVERVWILGASLGGPAAVKSFLDCLPSGLPVAFVYAQHIDQNAANVLVRVLGRHSAFDLKEVQHGARLHYGEVVIMPVDHEVVFSVEGTMEVRENAWPGPYGPSIDQVMLNVGGYYSGRCNAIIFSGMGNDGSLAGPLLRAYGSRIWSQTSDTCANSSMPDSVAATGCVEFRGTPHQLAEKLLKTVELEELAKRKRGLA